MFKVDFHTHSYASPDGGVTAEQYRRALQNKQLHYIAVTDHNRIDAALELQKELGEQIIVGEEIMTTAGEIVGLFLTEVIPAGLSPLETIKQIKEQRGLVYIPHPFETVRKGMHASMLDELIEQIDIVEVCNGRAFLQNKSSQAVVWARMNRASIAASSDAHGSKGLGKTYTVISEAPTKDGLIQQLQTGQLITDHPSLRSLLYPKYHRLRRKLRRSHA